MTRVSSWGAGRLSTTFGIICFAIFALLSAINGGPAAAAPPNGYALTWSDEFNGAIGSQANPANWTYDLGYGATNFGNDEQETYTNSYANSHIISDPNATDGLALQIIALNNNGNITSARLKSLGRHTLQYGYVEARISAFNPSGNQGIWPAWWMMGQNIQSVGWPNCGEIDIMEQWNGNNQNNMSIHGPNMTGSSLTTTGPANCWINQYHIYGLLWTPTTITYYVDGVQEASYNQGSSPSWPFNQPFFYLLNIAVGGSGSFIGSWNSSTSWPQTMKVDYIREYQPAAVTFTATATATPVNVSVNSPVTLTVTAKDTGAATSGALIDCEVYNASGTRVFQQYTTNQTFAAGQTQEYTYSWTPTAAGTYTVKVGVFSANWASNYVFNSNAATVTATAVTAPAFTGTATATPASVSVNSPVTLSVTVKDTGGAASGIIIDCEVYNASGTRVFQQYTTNQTFSAGQTQQYTYTWTPTTTGTYTVKVGVFSANWVSNYVFNNNAATVTVH